MRLIKPFTHFTWPDFDVINHIENIARTCYQSEPNGRGKLIKKIMQRQHESVLEHVSIPVRFIIDRGVSHELVRHRLCAFSQESTRYCNYGKGVTFIIPPWVNISPGEYAFYAGAKIDAANKIWFDSMLTAEIAYLDLLDQGWTAQQARSVLPNSLKTDIVVTANLREWRHIFKMRTAPDAHPQMREVMVPLQKQFAAKCPEIFGV